MLYAIIAHVKDGCGEVIMVFVFARGVVVPASVGTTCICGFYLYILVQPASVGTACGHVTCVYVW